MDIEIQLHSDLDKHRKDDIEDWVRYELGLVPSITLQNPLSNEDLQEYIVNVKFYD